MKKLLYVYILFLAACAQPGSGDKNNPTPTPNPTPPTTSSNLTSFQKNIHFGVLEAAETRNKVITIKNEGTKATTALSFTTPTDGNFILSQDTCSGQTLAVSAQCTVKISFAETVQDTYAATFSVLGGNNTLTFRVGAIVKDMPEMLEGSNPSFLLFILQAEQQSDGSWQNGSLSFDLDVTLYIAQALAKAKQSLSLTTDVYGGSFGLDKTLTYLENTTAGGGGARPIDFTTDQNTVMPEWNRALPSGGMKLKEIYPHYLTITQYLHQVKNSSTSVGYSSYSTYLDSRRATASTADASAQYAYIWDRSRWNTFYGSGFVNSSYAELVENAYKNTYLLMKSLIDQNKITEFNQVAAMAYKHFLFNSADMNSNFNIIPKYSAVEFNHSSIVTANLDMTLSDYYNSCRQLSYGILILSLIHKHSTDIDPLDKDDIFYTNINYFWTILKNDYYSEINNMDGLEKTRCLPMMAQAALAVPNQSQVNPTEINNIYEALFSMIENDTEISNIQGFPMEGAESLKALTDGFEYRP